MDKTLSVRSKAFTPSYKKGLSSFSDTPDNFRPYENTTGSYNHIQELDIDLVPSINV